MKLSLRGLLSINFFQGIGHQDQRFTLYMNLYTATLNPAKAVIHASYQVRGKLQQESSVVPAKAGNHYFKNTGFPRIKYGAGSVKPRMTNRIRLMSPCIKQLEKPPFFSLYFGKPKVLFYNNLHHFLSFQIEGKVFPKKEKMLPKKNLDKYFLAVFNSHWVKENRP